MEKNSKYEVDLNIDGYCVALENGKTIAVFGNTDSLHENDKINASLFIEALKNADNDKRYKHTCQILNYEIEYYHENEHVVNDVFEMEEDCIKLILSNIHQGLDRGTEWQYEASIDEMNLIHWRVKNNAIQLLKMIKFKVSQILDDKTEEKINDLLNFIKNIK